MVTTWRDPVQRPLAPTELYATLLGGFALYRAGKPVDVGQRGTLAELSRYLVAHAGRPIPRDELIDLLWPDAGPERAVHHRLHVAVSSLRHALDAAAAANLQQSQNAARLLQLEDDTYSIAADAIVTDCDVFDAHYRHGQAAAAGRDYELAAASFQHALDAWSGDYVADRPYAEWTATRRAHFAERRLDALAWLCENALRDDNLMALADYAREILEADNLRERVHRHLMRAFYRLGERGRAVRQYRRCAEILHAELGVAPSRETERLYQAIRDDAVLPDERLSI